MIDPIRGNMLCANWIPTKLGVNTIPQLLDLNFLKTCTFQKGLSAVHINESMENPNTLLLSPEMNGYRLLMGHPLGSVPFSKQVTEILSGIEGASFSFGIDIWCAYYFWMYSKDGAIEKYYFYDDGDIDTAGDSPYDDLVKDAQYEDCIFTLSKAVGFDIAKMTAADLEKPATLFQFS